ncbi:hypothetical protein [Nonomuraea sediminis]|uniref:hypothetical protein n=1 Tax=Nonomuraea sediminis TaxID=2835864 RepID=UPI001BDDAE68|nr:hypothetical protein [Nonomuraea sediminis]
MNALWCPECASANVEPGIEENTLVCQDCHTIIPCLPAGMPQTATSDPESFIRAHFDRSFAHLRAVHADDRSFGLASNEYHEFEHSNELSPDRAAEILDAARDTPMYEQVLSYVSTICRRR